MPARSPALRALPTRSLLLGLALAWGVGLGPGAPTAWGQPLSFAPIVKAQRSKVVHINTKGSTKAGPEVERSHPFRFPDPGQGTGSGFIISATGYIVTNHHVVELADEIEVVLADERKFKAEIVGLDAQTDLALLKIAADLPAIVFGDSNRLEVGDWVIAIGNPLGLDHTVTAGIISAKGRNIFDEDNLAYGEFLQTDAAINPGNSGGPLFDLEGRVVGVNSAISRRGQGIGFAVPSNLVVAIVRQLRQHGRVIRGWLGVVIQEVAEEQAAALKLPPQTRGVSVVEILPESPAKRDGLRSGDVVAAFAGEPITKVAQLQKLVALTAPGSEVPVEGWRRAGETAPWQRFRISIHIGSNPQTLAAGQPTLLARLGVTALNIPEELRRRIKLENELGVLVEAVDPGSPGEAIGLRAGDIILEADRTEVGSRTALESVLERARSERIPLLVRRDNRILYLVLERAALGR